MKNFLIESASALLLAVSLAGCAEYERTGVEKSIYVNRPSLTLFIGEQVQLTASPTEGNYEWLSEDPAVVTVTGSGLAEGVGAGSTDIIVRDGDIRMRVPVTAIVRIPLEDVLLSETYIELLPAGKRNILVTFVPENANDLPVTVWRSENPDVAAVNEAGEIVAVGEGVTNVTYTAGDIVKTVVVDVAFTRPFKGPHVFFAAMPCTIKAAIISEK